MVCAGTLALYLRKCPARVRRSILQQGRQKLRSGWPVTKHYNSSCTAHTLDNMHCNFWRNQVVDIKKKTVCGQSQRNRDDVPSQASAAAVPRCAHTTERKWPPANANTSALSRRAQLPSWPFPSPEFLIIRAERSQSSEPCAAVQTPSRRGWLSQGPAAPFRRGTVEKCAKARIHNPFLAARLKHRGKAARRPPCAICSSFNPQLLLLLLLLAQTSLHQQKEPILPPGLRWN